MRRIPQGWSMIVFGVFVVLVNAAMNNNGGTFVMMFDSGLLTIVFGLAFLWNQRATQEIVRRKKIEDELGELKFIVNKSQAIAFLWQATEGWPVEYVSENISRFGYSPQDFISRRVLYAHIIHPDDLARVKEEIRQYTDAGETEFTQVYRIIDIDGGIHWLEDRTWIRRQAEGGVTHYQGIVVDITKRKNAEFALSESEEQFRQLVENINDILFMVDAKGIIEYISPAVHGLAGYSPDEVIGTPFLDYVYAEDRMALVENFRMSLSGQRETTEFRVRHKAGNPLWARSSGRPRYDGAEIIGIQGTLIDITFHKKFEETIQENEQRLKEAQRIAKLGQWELDLASNSLVWSDEIYRIFEIRSDEFGASYEAFSNAIHPDDRDSVNVAYHASVANKTPYDIVHRLVMTDGRIKFVREICHTEYDVSGKPLKSFGVVQDITELKRAEEELRHAKEAADTANRAKSEFLANMSHEIRTPLNSVLGFTELLGTRITDPQQKSYLEAIRSGGRSLLTLINDILDLSKIEAGKMTLQDAPVNLRWLFHELEQVFRLKIAEKHLDFHLEFAPDLPEAILADEARLRQILFNLIGNAVKFTERGRVTVAVRHVTPTDSESDAELEITVEDTGIGIPADQQEKIFLAFTQQDGQYAKKYGGTGLGLTITKRLVEMMRGSITVESKAHEGSRFIVTLHGVKLTAMRDDVRIQAPSAVKRKLFEPATVLVVDDVADSRLLICELLADSGLQVQEAENGEHAVSLIRTGAPDVVLMDLRMPVMDGYTATRFLKARPEYARIPVIALTASVFEEQKHIAEAGFDGFLCKPILPDDLWRELSRFLKQTDRQHVVERAKPADESGQSTICSRQLVEEIEQTFLSKWQAVRQRQQFEEIAAFADLNKIFGQQHALMNLKQFGEELLLASHNFDVDKIETLLHSYPNLMTNLRSVAEEPL